MPVGKHPACCLCPDCTSRRARAFERSHRAGNLVQAQAACAGCHDGSKSHNESCLRALEESSEVQGDHYVRTFRTF